MKQSDRIRPLLYIIINLLLFAGCNGAYSRQPSVPVNVRATGSTGAAQETGITVSWDESQRADVYYIYRGENTIPLQDAASYIGNSSTLSFLDTGALDELVDYHYAVSAADLYGENETALSESAVGWIKRKLWILKDELLASVTELKAATGTGGEIYFVFRNSLHELRCGRLTAQQEETAEGEAPADPVWNYTIKWASVPLGSAADLTVESSFEIAAAGDSLYVCYSDRNEGGKVSVKSISVEDPEGGGEPVWSVETVGQLPISTSATIASPRIAASGSAQTGVNLAVGWVEDSIYIPLSDMTDALKLSRFWTGASLVWEPEDLSAIRSEVSLGLGGGDQTARIMGLEPVVHNLRYYLAASCFDSPYTAVYQLNNGGTAWDAVGAAFAPAVTALNGVETDSFGGRLTLGLNLDNTIKFYQFESSWIEYASPLSGVSESEGFHMNGGNLFMREADGNLTVRRVELPEGEWSAATWLKRGRNAADATLEGVVKNAPGEFLQVETVGQLTFAFWIEGGSGYWAVLE